MSCLFEFFFSLKKKFICFIFSFFMSQGDDRCQCPPFQTASVKYMHSTGGQKNRHHILQIQIIYNVF